MTKQEEIREELKKRYRLTFVFLCSLNGWDTVDKVPINIIEEAGKCEDSFVNGFLSYLHSQGVMIKEDREQRLSGLVEETHYIHGINCSPLWGYEAVVPLIEEK